MDAVWRPNGAFPLSQQLRGAGELRAAFEANLSLAANKHTAARISLPDESDAPLFMARTRGAVQSRSVGAKTGSASRTILAGFQCGPAKTLVAAGFLLYGNRLRGQAVYVLRRKQGASESCLRRNATAILSNFALPCAPLGSETVFDGKRQTSPRIKGRHLEAS